MSVDTYAGVVGFAIVLYVIWMSLRSPFSCPLFVHAFDVSGRRSPEIDDLLDEFLIHGGFERIQVHKHKVDAWKRICGNRIQHSVLKRYRLWQYRIAVGDDKPFVFTAFRLQT